ncbi:MAG TPA: hypothetical protein VGQ42_15315 [Candidatus Dormibacteraeota bacterium]|jgi:hypothetical protein|nr:hypothetical protein [Candidatus Dormibacteraeota bacterium]
MSERDAPWNDVPADSDVISGSEEPDPAEVEGDEGEEVDVSRARVPDIGDKYHRDTLDERLAEEEPDRPGREQDGDDGEDDDESAEEAAIHVVPEDRG